MLWYSIRNSVIAKEISDKDVLSVKASFFNEREKL